jgi:hypothetical protein
LRYEDELTGGIVFENARVDPRDIVDFSTKFIQGSRARHMLQFMVFKDSETHFDFGEVNFD